MSYKVDASSEIWKDIKGFEGLYQVSNLGRIRSTHEVTKKRRNQESTILKNIISPKGYCWCNLSNGEYRRQFRVHRLVADAFLPNPNNLPHINHKNEVKTDNRVENLEWCDSAYNNNYGTRTHRVAKHFAQAVIQFDLDGNFVARYPSAQDAQRATNIRQSGICCVANYLSGKSKKPRHHAGGYVWKWENNN